MVWTIGVQISNFGSRNKYSNFEGNEIFSIIAKKLQKIKKTIDKMNPIGNAFPFGQATGVHGYKGQ